MKIDWFLYSRRVLCCLLACLFVLTIFSADYVAFPVSLILVCLYLPLLFEQPSLSPRKKWYALLLFIAAGLPFYLILRLQQLALSYSETTGLFLILAFLIASNSYVAYKESSKDPHRASVSADK